MNESFKFFNKIYSEVKTRVMKHDVSISYTMSYFRYFWTFWRGENYIGKNRENESQREYLNKKEEWKKSWGKKIIGLLGGDCLKLPTLLSGKRWSSWRRRVSFPCKPHQPHLNLVTYLGCKYISNNHLHIDNLFKLLQDLMK